MRAFLLLFCACDAENILALGRNSDPCDANLPPQCTAAPRCVLDTNEFITGKFPGSKSFVVRTEGAAKLTFNLLMEHARGSGTELLLKVMESNCSDTYTYDNMGRDIVRLANTDGVLKVELRVTRGGDHPVQLTSDAYLDWTLVVDIENQMPMLE